MSFETAKAWCVRAAAALYGFTLGVALAPQLVLRASPRELPGVLQAAGISPQTPVLQLVTAILLTIAGAIAGNVAVRYLGCSTDTPVAGSGPGAPTLSRSVIAGRDRLRACAPGSWRVDWATVAFCTALLSAPVTLMHFGSMRHVVLHGVVAVAVVFLRRLQPRFSRADIVLIPVVLSTYFAMLDIGFGKTPAATLLRAAIVVFALRLIVGTLATNPRPALAFAAAPLALLFQMQWMSVWASGMTALIWITATSLAVSWALRGAIDEARVRRFAAMVAYPIVVAAYPLALLGISSAPAVDFFEDGHDLMPASEMMRGEVPYRDVIPVHGLISDGGLDLLAMKGGAQSIGTLLKIRRVEASLNLVAIYAVAVAATGSAEAGLLAVFLGVAIWPSSTLMVRVIPSLAALAMVAAAVRLRSRRKLLAAGATIVVAVLFSLEFAVYSAAVASVAVLRWGRDRRRALLALLAGIGAVAVPLLAVFAAMGFARDFVTVSLMLMRTAGVHVRSMLGVPECFRSLSALTGGFTQPECFAFALWVIALVACAAVLSVRPMRAQRRDAVWIVAMWIVIAAMSYAERQHLYFAFALPPFLVAVLYRMTRSRGLLRIAAIACAILLFFIARPFAHVFDVATPLRRSAGMTVPGAVELRELPRGRGALIDPAIAGGVHAAQSFMAKSLRPGDTFFDFANASLLYYLFNRRSPTRYAVVTFYESEEAQREVIAALERDRSVRAVLIAFPGAYSAIDGVPNRLRAPLVFAWLQRNFRPAFDQDGVVFWTR